MGLIVEFPEVLTRRIGPVLPLPAEGAQVVILPVVRIERHADTPSDGHDGGEGTKSRRRRRRARS